MWHTTPNKTETTTKVSNWDLYASAEKVEIETTLKTQHVSTRLILEDKKTTRIMIALAKLRLDNIWMEFTCNGFSDTVI